MDRAQSNAIRVINDYYRYLMNWKDSSMHMYVVMRWAAVTLKKEILNHPEEPPLLVIERFYDELVSYCEIAQKKDNSKWHDFNYAKSAVRDIMHRLGVR